MKSSNTQTPKKPNTQFWVLGYLGDWVLGCFLMRITGGQAGGRILRVPKGMAVRPTPDLVKQAVFNSLGERVIGARVLELFAGSGALSLESLSRGAAAAVCVEKAAKHAQFIRDNAAATGAPPAALEVRVQDVFAALPQLAAAGRQFDLILADPPYGDKNVGRRSESLAQQLLDDGDLHAPVILAEALGLAFLDGHVAFDLHEGGGELADEQQSQADVHDPEPGLAPGQLQAAELREDQVEQEDSSDQPSSGEHGQAQV